MPATATVISPTAPVPNTRADVLALLDATLPGREGPDWCWLPGAMHVGVTVAEDGSVDLTGRGLPASAVRALLSALPPILT